jgi:nitrous oxide reductase
MLEGNMKTKAKSIRSRRDFLKKAALGVGTAAVAGKALSADEAAATPALKPNEEGSYRETEHVKKYYEIARS